MKKFNTMLEATELSRTLSNTWLVRDTGEYVDADGLNTLANAMDEMMSAKPEEPPHRFLCSNEGAIGITYDFEYNAQWFIYPMTDEDKLAEEVFLQMEKDLDALKVLKREELVKIAKETGIEPVVNKVQQDRTDLKFCTNCGNKLESGLKFCTKCGRKL